MRALLLRVLLLALLLQAAGATQLRAELEYLGSNFGGVESITSVLIDGEECPFAKWHHPADNDGKNITLLTVVALQTIERFGLTGKRLSKQSLVSAICKCRTNTTSGTRTVYYGHTGEYCVPCPEGGICQQPETMDDPYAKPKFWLALLLSWLATTEFDGDLRRANGEAESLGEKPNRCDPKRWDRDMFGKAIVQDRCADIIPCTPANSCTSNNTCAEGYQWQIESCLENNKRLLLAKPEFCSSDLDCDPDPKKECGLKNPEHCSVCVLGDENALRSAGVTKTLPSGNKLGICQCRGATRRCALCTSGTHYRPDGKFEPCPSDPVILIILLVCAVVCACIGGYVLGQKRFNMAFLSNGVVSFFNFNVDITAPECLVPDLLPFKIKWYAMMGLPLMAGVLGALCFVWCSKLCFKFCCKGEKKWRELNTHASRILATFTLLYYYMYLSLTKTGLRVFNCNPIVPPIVPVDGGGFLYTCRCDIPDGLQSAAQKAPAALGLVVCTLGCSAFILIILKLYKGRIKKDQLLRAANIGNDWRTSTTNETYTVRKRWHKLYYHFKPEMHKKPTCASFIKLIVSVLLLQFATPTFASGATSALSEGRFNQNLLSSEHKSGRSLLSIRHQKAVFKIATSGICSKLGTGWHAIDTQANCEQIAKDWGYQWGNKGKVATKDKSKVPDRCWHERAWGCGNEYRLYWNTASNPSKVECKDDKVCLCMHDCQTGQYQDEDALRICKTCPKGFYQDETQRNYCKSCERGYYQDLLVQKSESSCKECPEGKYQPRLAQISQDTCTACPFGFIQPGRASVICKFCPQGFYEKDHLQCLSCPTGWYQNQISRESCFECRPGQYANESGSRECLNCPMNWYSDQIESTNCTKCKNGESSHPGGANETYNRSKEIITCNTVEATDIVIWFGPSSGKSKTVRTNSTNELQTPVCPSSIENIDLVDAGASCPSQCNDCHGRCSRWCSNSNWCGTSSAHQITDCRGCSWIGSLQIITNGMDVTATPSDPTRNNGWTSPVSVNCTLSTYENCTSSIVYTKYILGSVFCTKCSPGQFMASDSFCRACPRGYVSIFGQEECDECTAGKYANSVVQATQCELCGPGRYGTPNLHPSQRIFANTSCQNCTFGKYSSTLGIVSGDLCNDCPPGKYSNATGNDDSDDCQRCNRNTYTELAGSKVCQHCNISETSGEGATYCFGCGAGQYMNISSGSQRSCVECPQGFASVYGQYMCDECAVGQFANRQNHANRCLLCGAGKYGRPNLTAALRLSEYKACAFCPVATYSSAKGVASVTGCNECPPGKYANTTGNDDVRFCKKCPQNWFSDQSKQQNCTQCGAGSAEAGATFCELCPSGRYMDVDNGRVCVDCPAGYISKYGQKQCDECAIGQFASDYDSNKKKAKSCSLCPIGKYGKTLTGPSDRLSAGEACEDCGMGRYSAASGVVDDTGCNACPPGKHSNKAGVNASSQCNNCNFDSFSEDEAQVECRACPTGYYQQAKGMTTCNQCIPGQHISTNATTGFRYCQVCGRGNFSFTAGFPCQACPAGMYAKDDKTTCLGCPSGYWSDATGLNDATDCQQCKKGTYSSAVGVAEENGCNACPPGKHSNVSGIDDASKCKNCPRDYYNDDEEQEECKSCDSGFYQKKEGKTGCVQCDPGTELSGTRGSLTCLKCDHGRFSATAGANCTPCLAGTYAKDDHTECLPCPAGFWSNVSMLSSYTQCKHCEKGTYSSAKGVDQPDGCNKCSPGKYGIKRGAVSAKEGCNECDQGYYQPYEAQIHCYSCVENYGAGSGNVGLGNSGCVSVPPGSFVDAITGGTVPCPRGSMCKGADKGIVHCRPGKYANNSGSVSCFPCAPGRYAFEEGSLECSKCPSGWVQEEEGKGSCHHPPDGAISAGGASSVEVAAGWFASDCKSGVCESQQVCPAGTKGMPNGKPCQPCPAGKTSFAGSVTCSPCSKGKYADTADTAKKSLCFECPAGYYQPQDTTPSKECKICPRGYDAVLQTSTSGVIEQVTGSAVCRSLNWIRPEECTSEHYLNNTDANPSNWKCVTCPPGGACIGAVSWDNLHPLFGWWKIPEDERKSEQMIFAPCIYKPACLGAHNPALENRFFDENKNDLAKKGNVPNRSKQYKYTCATELGFLNNSRLCHICNASSRRQGIARCSLCPTFGQNIGLIILGVFVTIGVIIFLVVSSIQDAGEVKLSESVQKILLNYLQVVSFAQAFPLRWPPVLEGMFEFQGAVSTLGEHLLSPDCLSTAKSAADLFYSKQVMLACTPFIVFLVSFLFWMLYARCKGVSFFKKRADSSETTSKDKFVATVCTIIYLLFPTLCTQAFNMFHCRVVAGKLYLAADMEEPCFEGRHLVLIFLLGMTQIIAFVVGLPMLVLVFLCRSKNSSDEGLKKHATIVRYGLFYGAYKDETYYWEVVITGRKIGVVALAIFGPGMGTERQAQMALALLLICISLEIAGDPFRLVTNRFRVLGRLEIATLFVQWATMWCGSMIFASQDLENESFVMFLTVAVAVLNISMLTWLVVQLLMECAREKQEDRAKKAADNDGTKRRSSFQKRLSDLNNSVKRWRSGRKSPEKRQSHVRERTIGSLDSNNLENPFSVQMAKTPLTEDGVAATDNSVRRTMMSVYQSSDNIIDSMNDNPMLINEPSADGNDDDDSTTGNVEILTDEMSGKRYSYNHASGESKWLKPSARSSDKSTAVEIINEPSEDGNDDDSTTGNVEIFTDEMSGKRYSYNHASGESKWLGV